MTATLTPSHGSEQVIPATPFVGLVPYGEGDAAFFFGRDEEKAIITANLRASRLTILYGASGVGKTSVLHAGVVHDLHEQVREIAAGRSQRPPFAVCAFSSWRDDPLSALAETMRTACSEALGGEELPPWQQGEPLLEAVRGWTERVRPLLVVLDQFEEYFLYHAAEEGEGTFAVEFPRLVNEPNLRLNVILSLREDAWAKLDRFEDSIPPLFDNYVRVDHLGTEAAREAIDGPVREWNRLLPPGEEPYAVEPALAKKVIEAAAAGRLALTESDNSGAPEAAAAGGVEAPFLQLVLDRLWRATVDAGADTLDLARLETLGGAQQIVENHLLDALGKLTLGEQAAAADLFRYLVTRSKTKIAHPATDLAEWTERPESEVTAVLEKLCRGESGRILRSVSPPAGETVESYELFHDVLAEPILEWRKGYEQERDRRLTRKRFARIGGALLSLVAVFAALGVWALVERANARSAARLAQSQAMAARVPGLLRGRLDDAMLLSLDALGRRSDSVDARKALLAAVQRTDGLVRFLRFAQPVNSLAVARNGTIAVALDGGKIALLDRRGRNVRETLVSQKHSNVDAVAFDPVRPLLAAAVTNKVELFRPERGTRGAYTLKPIGKGAITDQDTSSSISFSKDGRWLAAGGRGGLTLWRVDNAGHLRAVPIRGARSNVTALAFHGSQPLLVAAVAQGLLAWKLHHLDSMPRPIETGTADALAFGADGGAVATRGRAYLWHGSPSARLEPLDRVGGSPTALAFNDGNSLLALGDANGRLVLWGVKQRHPVGSPLLGQSGRIVSIAFEPASSVVAVASADHTVALWDTESRARALRVSEAFGNDVGAAVFGRNGILAALTNEGTLKVADLDRTPRVRVVTHQGAGYNLLYASPNGRRLVVAENSGALAALNSRMEPSKVLPLSYPNHASVANDGSGVAVNGVGGSVQLWDSNGRSLGPLVPPNPWVFPLPVAISADGHSVAAYYGGPGKVVLWRLTGTADPKGTILGSLAAGTNANDLAFSPDGTVLALANDDEGTIELWSVGKPGGRSPTSLPGGPAGPATIAFAPDGGILASVGVDHTIRLWALQKGLEELGSLTLTDGSVTSIAFSPDGRWLVAVQDGKLSLWDVTLWQQTTATLDLVRQRFCAALWSESNRPCQ